MKEEQIEKGIAGRQPEKSFFEILSDFNRAVPNHLADKSQTRYRIHHRTILKYIILMSTALVVVWLSSQPAARVSYMVAGVHKNNAKQFPLFLVWKLSRQNIKFVIAAVSWY